jgi:hypothetical protein
VDIFIVRSSIHGWLARSKLVLVAISSPCREHFGAFYMAATYRNHGEPYRESLHSVQSASVYSTDSGSIPLDSIIREYPLVPGASPNAFQFSPNSYGSSQRSPVPSVGKSQQYQQQPGVTTRLRQLQSPPGQSGQFSFTYDLLHLSRMLTVHRCHRLPQL